MSNKLLIVSGIGAIQCVLFILLLLIKKGKKISDIILMCWFFVFFAHLMIFINKELIADNLATTFIRTIGFLHGPLFYLYAKSLFNLNFNRIDSLHFLPFSFFTVFSFFIPSDIELFWKITILITKLISIIFYTVYILFLYHRKRNQQKNRKLANRIHELSWIRIIAILFLISIGVSIVRLTVERIVGVSYFEIWDLLRYIILVTVIGFYGLKYGMVYKPEIPYESIEDYKKYKHSPLKNDEIKGLLNTIDNFFKENQMYLKPEFSLDMLATSIKVPKHHLSQVINSEMKTTFYDLVNTKRIEYAMLKIKEAHNLNITLEGIGYECGFNSKSAFFRNFKKKTGKTPGQYQKEISTD